MSDESKSTEPTGWPIYETWQKYEDVAMHFNDLLIRLRTQALGAVAAISTLVGLFTKTATADTHGTWEIAAGMMGTLCVLWVALWVLDIMYYNRLLIGSVAAILKLEELSKTQTRVSQLNLSTLIADAVVGKKPLVDPPPAGRFTLLRGVWIFYGLVFVLLIALFTYCMLKYICAGSADA